MAATDSERPGRPDGVVLGLLVDPDLPAELAGELAGELPELLAERLDAQVSWQVRVLCQRLDLGDEERLLAIAHERLTREGWDLVVCLTDLPRRSGLRPILAEASVADRVALASRLSGPAGSTGASGNSAPVWRATRRCGRPPTATASRNAATQLPRPADRCWPISRLGCRQGLP